MAIFFVFNFHKAKVSWKFGNKVKVKISKSNKYDETLMLLNAQAKN